MTTHNQSSISCLSCSNCKEVYDLNVRKMCTGTCHHSICEPCFNRKSSASCPICKTENSFVDKIVNWRSHDIVLAIVEMMTFTNFGDVEFDAQTGACSECGKSSNKLRICESCSVGSGLLIKTENGSLELRTETSEKFFETVILHIRRTAICSDCILDEKKHEGHDYAIPTNVKLMSEASEVLETLSALRFAIQKMGEENGEYQVLKFELIMLTFGTKLLKVMDQNKERMARNHEKNSDTHQIWVSFFNLVLAFLHGCQGYFEEIAENLLLISALHLSVIEDEKEKKRWERTILKLVSIRDFHSSREPNFNLNTTGLKIIFDLVSCGSIERVFQDLDLLKAGENNITEVLRDIWNGTKDFRKTLRLPPENGIFGQFVNIIIGNLESFFETRDRKLEDLELD